MEKNEEKVLERNLEQKHFENAAKAIKGGKESGSLTNINILILLFFYNLLNKQDKTKRLWDIFLNLYILTISLL